MNREILLDRIKKNADKIQLLQDLHSMEYEKENSNLEIRCYLADQTEQLLEINAELLRQLSNY